MNTQALPFLTWREIIIVTLMGSVATVLWALHVGQNLNPDLLNYHFYNAYVALNKQRLLTAIFPAGLQ